MDEPLSNLDAKLRVQTRAELVELQRRLAATIVYVTHDQVEAMTMGHRIAVLDAGVLQQVGAPQDVYARPANLFVARFIGSPPMNTVDRPRRPRSARRWSRSSRAAHVPARPGELATAVEARGLDEVVIGVRPEDLRFAAAGGVPGHGERGRVARSRAPRRVPPRRPAAGDRAPGRARGRAGRGRAPPTSSPTPARSTCSIPVSGARIGD